MVDEPDWHARVLSAAFTRAGATVTVLRLAACRFAADAPGGLELPGFGPGLPDAVFVRAVAAGSFEEITRRLGILHALRVLGVTVWNDARAVERCVDKSTTSFLLAHAGLPTPPTWAVEGIDAARAIVAAEGEMVLKPLFGSQGRGLRRLHAPEDVPPPEEVGGVYYLQRFVAGPSGFRDHRLLVCGSAVLGAMTRHGTQWVTNLHQGARPEALVPDPVLHDLAVRAVECVGAAYGGVDILRDRNGAPMVLEVNSMPGWRGLQSVTDTDIAEALVTALLASLP